VVIQAFCLASKFVTGDTDAARTPQRFIPPAVRQQKFNNNESQDVAFITTFGVKNKHMIIEKTKNQILIKVSPKVDPFGFQRIMDYLEYLEITSKSKAKQSDADKLANEINNSWWEKNKNNFLQ